MKKTLTTTDPSGWYECAEVGWPEFRGVKYVCRHQHSDDSVTFTVVDTVPVGQCQEHSRIEKFTDFVRLVPMNEIREKCIATMDAILGM